MTKQMFLLVLTGLTAPAATAAEAQPAVPSPTLAQALKDASPASAARRCTSSDPAEVVVCGRSASRYRIDPSVLASARAVEARPPKPLIDASREQSCVGPDCGGATIPLVGMALVALKAAELAADGDDWREAFRTRPDAYRAYEDAKAKQATRPSVSVSVGAGTRK